MGMSNQTAEAIAEAFVAARREVRALSAFPGLLPGSLEDAYQVQERTIALSGKPVRGWKVAMIHPDLRPILGAQRLAGPVFAGAVHRLPLGGRTAVAVFEGGFAALEAEFVAKFARDLRPGPEGVTKEAILEALESLHAGMEVASSPLATLNDIGPIAVVCDQGNNAGAVVGPELPGWRTAPLESLTSQMAIDGQLAGAGSAASVPDGPLGALAFLAEHLASRGRHIAAGDIVLTGMTTGIHRVHPGSHGRIVFSGVPDCDVDVIAAARIG